MDRDGNSTHTNFTKHCEIGGSSRWESSKVPRITSDSKPKNYEQVILELGNIRNRSLVCPDFSSLNSLKEALAKSKVEYVNECEKILHLDYLIAHKEYLHNIHLHADLDSERSNSFENSRLVKRSIDHLSALCNIPVEYPFENKYGSVARQR